jgi:hypothetical protein
MQNQMMEKLAEEGIDNTKEASIMTQVIEGPRSGHVRGMGYGVIPTSSSSWFRDAIHINNHEECHKKMEAMQEKIDMLMEIVLLENIYNIIYFYTHSLIVIMDMIMI